MQTLLADACLWTKVDKAGLFSSWVLGEPCCCPQVLFQDGRLQWKRLENLIGLAREGSAGLDLSDTVRDGARVVLMDNRLRTQLLMALTEDDRLHVAVRP